MPGNGASGIFFVNSEQNNNAMKKIWAYILPTALCFVLGGLAGWLQQDAIEEWYPLLDKPTLTPPNAVFPIAWSIIYLCMGISGGLVLTSEAPARKSAVRLCFLQLGCNFLWSILFFVCRSPLLGMADIVVLDVLVILYLVRSANVRAAALPLLDPFRHLPQRLYSRCERDGAVNRGKARCAAGRRFEKSPGRKLPGIRRRIT